MNIVLWIIQIVLGITFLGSGINKLARPRLALVGQLPYVADFSDSQVKGIGTLELLAAIGLIVPPILHVATFLTPLAAVGLILLMGGAIATPVDRRELARVIGRLARLQWDQYPTDHVMTKANYLWDPDGNGIEIYTESPEDGTLGFANGTFVAYDKDGRERSGRDPIDMDELFSHLQPGDSLDGPMPDGTKMGHVHLHVADVDD